MIPGGNILNQALSLIARQSFQYLAFVSRQTNSIGIDESIYASPVAVTGSIQPLPRSLYEQYGLDFQRNYVNVYVSKSMLDINRDVAGDQIIFNGTKFEGISKTNWFPMDGWISILCVEIPRSDAICC